MQTAAEYIEHVRRQADNYERTIQAMICMDSALRFDDNSRAYRPGSQVFQGKRMRTSPDNCVSPNVDVTPDLVVQYDNSHGVVAEVKLSASSERDFSQAKQSVTKYDDDLTGWETDDRRLSQHDLCLIVNLSHVRQAEEHLETSFTNRLLCSFPWCGTIRQTRTSS